MSDLSGLMKVSREAIKDDRYYSVEKRKVSSFLGLVLIRQFRVTIKRQLWFPH